jgi:guanylate kinase
MSALFIVSAPSGAGKTSLVAALLDADPRVKLSVSFTTRAPRKGEVNGRNYNFVPVAEFERMREHGEFLESARVHGNYYGTSAKWIEAQFARGFDILLEIDWQGAAQVKRLRPEAVQIFILPPSYEALNARLNTRATDSAGVIAQRLAAAREEMSHLFDFDYVIINEDFDRAAQDLAAVITAERLKTARQVARHRDTIEALTQQNS